MINRKFKQGEQIKEREEAKGMIGDADVVEYAVSTE